MSASFFYCEKLIDAIQLALRQKNGERFLISTLPLDVLRKRLAGINLLASDFDDTAIEGSVFMKVRELFHEHDRLLEESRLTHYLEVCHECDPVELGVLQASWLGGTLSLMLQSGAFTRYTMRLLAEQISWRSDITTLFLQFQHRVIVSFGIRQIIQEFLNIHHLQSDVLAVDLLFDNNDVLHTYDHASIVVGPNKGKRLTRHINELNDRLRGELDAIDPTLMSFDPPVSFSSTLIVGDDPHSDGFMWHPEALNVLVAKASGKLTDPLLATEHWNKIHVIASSPSVLLDYMS